MHRIDTATAQKDKFGAGKNGFTRGNPQTGVPATDLDDDYFDTLQEELAAFVEAAGDELDKAQRNQVLIAAQKLFAPANATITALSALVGAANKVPYFTGQNAAALADLTSVGRQIIGKATIAEVLTYLGLGDLGTAAKKNVGTGVGQIPDMSSFTAQLGNPAVFEFPNGLIIQTGTINITSGNQSITLPRAFPNAHISAWGTMNPDVSATNIEHVQAWPSSNSTLRLQSAYISGSSIGPITSGLACWGCMGY